MHENYPAVVVEKTREIDSLLRYLHTYVELNDRHPGQLQQYDDSDPDAAPIDGDKRCHYSNKYSAAKRAAFYPFSKAKKVLLVSFVESSVMPYEQKEQRKIPDLADVKNTKELSPADIITLTDIVYNNGYKKEERNL